MNQAELWWSILSILPFGILVMFCARCRLFGNRTIIREETRRKGQSINMNEDGKRFEVVRSYTVSRPEQTSKPEPKTENVTTSNDLQAFQGLYETGSKLFTAADTPSYGNINIANKHELDQNYINPLAAEYYCFPDEFHKPPVDDDSNSYENVEIDKTENRTSEESGGSYENCEYAIKWKQQEKPEEKRAENNNDENDDDDDDPDYVNTVPCPSL